MNDENDREQWFVVEHTGSADELVLANSEDALAYIQSGDGWRKATAEEIVDLEYRVSSLTQWHDIQAVSDCRATDDAIEETFCRLPCLVRDNWDGSVKLIDCHNVDQWMDILKRDPSKYQWRVIQ